ncbi:MAG: dTMP kinase [Candidatus Aureabacteria bacterium]|nr:dTMP kinase [Candidatus Auribacterota bacterium]
MTIKRGKFITLEGPEGSGKSTHLKMLEEYLKGKGFDVLTVRDPGGTKIGERIREILLDPAIKEMNILTELFLFEASRAQLVHEKIREFLWEDKEKVVLSSRFTDATVVYQGYGRFLNNGKIGMIKKLNDIVVKDSEPDLTILLDIDVKEGLKRARGVNKDTPAGELDRIESETIKFHRGVREGYLKLQKEEPERIKIIDSSKFVEEVHKEIRIHVNRLLNIK